MILFGASGHGKVVIDILKKCDIPVSAIWDDDPQEDSILGIIVLQTSEKIPQYEQAIITIGNNDIRRKIAETYSSWKYITAIHPSAVISDSASVDDGTVIMANAVVNPSAIIGKHCILNSGSVIEHDCVLRDYVHVSPNVALAGNVEVGEGTHIGIGACVIQGIKIGKWCTIGAGAVIIRDVPDFSTVVGNPGRIIKIENQN